MKVVGISGAQGAGKSTLLKELLNRGWKLDEFRVSRAVQAQLKWDTLEQVMDSPVTMQEFQEEVFKQKYSNDYRLARDDSPHVIILTERTFADVDAYTTQWAWRFFEEGRMTRKQLFEFLTPFHASCVDAQLRCYHATILLPFSSHMPWDADPNRASRADVEVIYDHIDRFVFCALPADYKRTVIYARSVDDRCDAIEKFLETI